MTPPGSNDIEVVHDLLVPVRDGSAWPPKLYRPAGRGRSPCLVTYLPYHKDGRGGLWYDGVHRFFARRGYATLVADLRGLGCSEGLNNTPFDAREGRDGHDLVEWAAAQPWCDGNVGMWGTSYGGITALKAAERPAHLRAIVPVNATWDNHSDFLLLGGCRNGQEVTDGGGARPGVEVPGDQGEPAPGHARHHVAGLPRGRPLVPVAQVHADHRQPFTPQVDHRHQGDAVLPPGLARGEQQPAGLLDGEAAQDGGALLEADQPPRAVGPGVNLLCLPRGAS
jgi:hypothetical protein